MKENFKDFKMTGKLTDKITNLETGEETIIEQGFNTICTNCHALIAALIGNISNTTTSDADVWFAIGSSANEVSQGDDKLGDELFRVKATCSLVAGAGNENQLTITCNFPDKLSGLTQGSYLPSTLSENDYNSTWEECGIFKGGDNLGLGYLINHKLAKLAKNNSFAVTRTFTFTF